MQISANYTHTQHKESKFPTLGPCSVSAGISEEAFLAFRTDMRLIRPFSRQRLYVKLRYATCSYATRGEANSTNGLRTRAKLRQNHLKRVLFCFLFGSLEEAGLKIPTFPRNPSGSAGSAMRRCVRPLGWEQTGGAAVMKW